MKTFNILLFLLTLSSSSLLGQSISGASSADINTTVTYSYNRGSGLGSVNWSVTKGTVLSTSNSGTTYYASIKWTQEGTGTVGLTFFGSPSQWPSTKNVTISVPVVTPSTPNIQSQNCGNTVLSRNGNPPSGTTWYWQGTNPNGTATLGSGSTYTATSNGTYYIRAYKNGTWSPAAGRSVTVKVKPSTPSAPSISKNCGNTVATRSSPPSGVTWYWQTSSSGTSTSNSSSTYTRTSNGTVYLRARHNSSGCWSASRTVGFSVNSKPGTPSTPSIAKNCGNTVLTRGSHPSGITWYWQTSSSGTSTSNSSSTYTRTSNGTVYLRGRNNSTGCWSNSRSVSVSVNAKPPTPSTPSVTQNCGNTVLTRGSHPSGITWYWQTSSSGTSTSNSSSTYTRTSNGTVYLRARNNSTGCWGTARAKSVTVKVKPPTPSSPIIDKNCGNTILNRASPPSGITWYWQTSSSGTSTSNSSASYTRTSNGTVYLRARNNSTGCWGNSRSISVSVNQKPGTPSTPSIAKNCGNTVLTRGSHPSGITWYWQTSSSGTSTSNSSSTYTRTSNGTVYLRARNNSTQCWGNSRSVSVSVNAKPPTPSTPSVTQNCGNTVLTRGSHPSGITWYWQTSSSGTSTSNSSSTYTRTSNGTVYLRARNNSTGCWGTARAKSVTIKVKPPTPSSPIVDKNCGNTVLNRASPPSGITWYWQTSSSGTSTSNSSASYTRTSNGTVYLRARNNSTGCWGTSRSILVSVNQKPATPSTPSIAKNCGNTVLTRGSHPSGITWYWQTSSSGTSTSNSSSTYTRTSNGTVYLRARNNSTHCWGTARSVSVSVNQRPGTPSTPSIAKNCGNTVLTRGSHPSGITWYWQTSSSGTSTSNSSSTYTRTSNGTVYLRARNNSTQCWGTARSVGVSVNAKPPKPSTPTSAQNCGSTVLTRGAHPSGITWYWQTSSSGTSTSNSSSTYTRTSNGTVYLRARNNSTQCWGTARSVSVSIAPIPAAPALPTIAENCGSTVLTMDTSTPSALLFYWQASETGQQTATVNANASYTMQSSGTIYLRARDNSGCWGTARAINVAVRQVPAMPSNPIIDNDCGNTALTRIAPPSNETWYWQTSSNGKNTAAVNANATYNMGTSGTIYLRSKNDNNCWSAARPIPVSVTELPDMPASPTVTQNCGTAIVSRGAAASGETWYWQTGLEGTSTSAVNTNASYTMSSAGTLYLRAKNNTTQCWSPARSVSVSIDDLPAIPAEPSTIQGCGSTVLTMDTSTPSAHSFFWQTSETGEETGAVNADGSYTVLVDGTTIYLRARDNSGCWGTARSINVAVKEEPSMPPSPIVYPDCGSTTLARVTPPSGETWFWQTSDTGTSTAAINADPNYSVSSSGTVYLRAKSDNGCWGVAKAIPLTVTSLPDMPTALPVTQNCGEAIANRGDAASGETWYWQTSAGGTSTSATNASATYPMSAAGTIYLRAKNNTTECWSLALPVDVTVDPIPTAPLEPTVVENCGSTVLTMDNTTPSAHSFFWQTSETGEETGVVNADGSYTVLVDGTTIYLRARDSSGCWGTARSINVTVKEEPSTPPSPIVYPDCGSTALARINPPSGETWYWQTSDTGTSTAAINADPTYSVSSSGTMYLRAKSDNGCWGVARAIPLTVTGLPDMPTAAFPTQECGTTTLQRGASPSGETWYWQTTVDGESTANSGTIIPVTTDGDMYLRAKDDVTDCWGPARLINVDVLELPSTPPAPSIVQHCGSTVLTKGTAPAGETWYWQVGEFSEATTNANDNFTFNNTGFVYLRSLSDNGCWASSQLVNVSVQQEPAAPTTADVSRCDSGPVSMDATPGAGGNVVRWYSAETGGTLLHSGTAFTTTISETTSFWVSTYNALTGCENDQRVEVIASNYPTSSAPSVTIPEIICAGYATTLQSNSDQTEWYDVSSGGTPVYVGRNWTTTFNANATYYVETGNTNGCSLREPVMITLGAPVGGDLSGESDHFESANGTLNLSNHEGPILKWQSRTGQAWTDISNTTTNYNYSDLSEPTYFRVAVGPCAIEYSNEFLVNVIDAPVISWGNSFQLRPGSSENATVNSGYENYEWKKDGITVQNGSDNEYVISSPGEYHVVITTAANGIYNSEVVTFTSILDVDRNTIISYSYLTPTDDVSLSPHDFNANEMRIDAQFFDGLGRPTQSVSLAQTPLGADLVVPMEYDVYGRQTKTYLPYADASEAFFKSNALNPDYIQSDQNMYYTGNVSSENSYAFSETLLEKSPLGRTEKQGAPGEAWQIGQAEEHVVQYGYGVAEADQIYNWDMETFMTDNNPPKYETNQLLKNRVTDEDGNVSITYANKLGQTILKESQVNDSSWAGTYYIYDKLGQLQIVLPPMATDNLETQFLGQTAEEKVAFLDRWAFQYSYDSRNRMLTKQVPGAEEVRMVYDQWDRLVLTQDGNQRNDNEWLFTSYDQLNRPVITGILKDSRASVRTHAEMQSWIMGMADSQERSLTFSSGVSNQEYTSNAFPFSQTTQDIQIENILTVTYYDHYDWNTAGLTFDSSLNHMATVKGQVTGSLTKIADASDTHIKSASYYDEKYRPIQTQSTNHLGGKDVVTNYYDHIGQVEKTLSLHYQSSTTTDPLKVTRAFEYDFAGRLLQAWHQIGDDPDNNQLIVENNYNEHGELVEKKLHSATSDPVIEGGDFAQQVDFSYNRRGWLTSINDSGLTDGEGDLFGMELLYNDQDGTLGNTRLYNGNISAMQWSDYNSHTDESRAYTYGYDQLNRLKTADHFKGTADVSAFDVSNLSYDLNGNILSLNRAKETGNNMDELAYDYTGNRLNYVADNSGDSLGFNNGTTGTSMDYAYDANGNMVEDKNKGIDSIYYNHLNLPTTVFLNTSEGAGRIEYLYDAAGIKLQQKVWGDDTLRKTTDYVGEFIYENGDLQLIQHEEGRIINKVERSYLFSKLGNDVTGYNNNQNVSIYTDGTRIRAVSNQSSSTPGIWPIDGALAVKPGEEYTFDLKGYSEIGVDVYLYVTTDVGTSTWYEKKLPEGASNEAVISTQITIPAGATWIKAGALFSGQTAGDRFYISSTQLSKIESNEYDYQYHLKDHLGNTRLTFSTTPEEYVTVEGMESDGSNGPESPTMFVNIPYRTDAVVNTTPGGDEVATLGAGDTGVMIFCSVNKGDQMNFEVKANYDEDQISNFNLSTMLAGAIFDSYTNTPGALSELPTGAQTGVGSGVNSMAGVGEKATSDDAPLAYINYIYLKSDMTFHRAGYTQITTAANGPTAHEQVLLDVGTMEMDGYILAYLTNESNETVNVNFDDFTIRHTKTNVVQTDDYYPFGLTFNESVRTASTAQNFKFNGIELQDEWETYLADFRSYDPAIARWGQIDPKANEFESPYAGMGNNPILYYDFLGDTIVDSNGAVQKLTTNVNSQIGALNAMLANEDTNYDALFVSKEQVQGKVTALQGVLSEIDQMQSSEQVYNVTDAGEQGAGVSFDAETGAVNIAVDASSSVGLIGHELKHGSQFENGEISLVTDNSAYGALYDIGDETAGYERERLLSGGIGSVVTPQRTNQWTRQFGSSMSQPAYQGLPNGPINVQSPQGRAIQSRLIAAGVVGGAVREVVKGWQKLTRINK